VDIVRDNMAFGHAGTGEYGTYFIGYARSPGTTEQMLTNMFVGNPPGNYDRLLDFSQAMTGTLFFVPAQSLLDDFDSLGSAGASSAASAVSTSDTGLFQPVATGSLNIGSLRGDATT
jgi:putative iron-dependent peroxidase